MNETPQTAAPELSSARLPGPARRALRALENSYLSGTDAAYQDALLRLERIAEQLGDADRELLNAHLSAAYERVQSAERLREMGRALAGPWELVSVLPGDVELVRLIDGGDQMLAAVPAYRDDDTVRVRGLVTGAREALRAGRCSWCPAVLEVSLDDQATLRHRDRCRVSERKIERARAS